MKTTLPLLGLLLVISSCGNSPDIALSNLEKLMEENPELKKATLHQIKQTAQSQSARIKSSKLQLLTDDSASDDNLAFDVKKNIGTKEKAPKDSVLKPEIAKNAQELIEEILDNYRVKDEFNASLKILGLMVKTTQARLGTLALDDNEFVKEKLRGLDSDKKHPLNLKCEDIVAGRLPGFPADEIKQALDDNRAQVKAALSGCAKIQGEKFVSCLSIRNDLLKVVNENVGCDLNDLGQMQKKIEAHIKSSYTELKNKDQECRAIFANCGYLPKQADEAMKDRTR